jgi:hypothetical protein
VIGAPWIAGLTWVTAASPGYARFEAKRRRRRRRRRRNG